MFTRGRMRLIFFLHLLRELQGRDDKSTIKAVNIPILMTLLITLRVPSVTLTKIEDTIDAGIYIHLSRRHSIVC